MLVKILIYNLGLAVSLGVEYSKKLNFNLKDIAEFILEIGYELGTIPYTVEASNRCGPCTNTKTSTNILSVKSMQYTTMQRRTLLVGTPCLNPITIETII